MGSTDIRLVILEGVAVIHLQSRWCPETVDAHGEATAQSYQHSQVRHLPIQDRHVLLDSHRLLGHSIEHIESGLVFFLQESKGADHCLTVISDISTPMACVQRGGSKASVLLRLCLRTQHGPCFEPRDDDSGLWHLLYRPRFRSGGC